MSGAATESPLSIVIPCWNDAEALTGILQKIRKLQGIREIIVADASSGATCSTIAHEKGACVVKCPTPSRGRQMNAGAREAGGALLLFQHADTDLTQAHVDALLTIAGDPKIAGGAFHRKFDSRHRTLQWLEPIARGWARLGGSFYGDQSIFVRRSVFEQMGGFAEIPLMEDLEFSGRLRAVGRIALLDPPIASSPRHAERHGPWRTTIRNGMLITLFHLGVSPRKLHAWYYRLSAPVADA